MCVYACPDTSPFSSSILYLINASLHFCRVQLYFLLSPSKNKKGIHLLILHVQCDIIFSFFFLFFLINVIWFLILVALDTGHFSIWSLGRVHTKTPLSWQQPNILTLWAFENAFIVWHWNPRDWPAGANSGRRTGHGPAFETCLFVETSSV